ncbi:Hypothetical predicted protein [Cloeon dipterum]|uniref:PSI domain-containing protein n=1 Tax=Cloeon dipterum TaxID=197152 RepID=A0A8S1DBY1_9INSE|nr:Hypothetical predicted protein [Cloeon dipterum]
MNFEFGNGRGLQVLYWIIFACWISIAKPFLLEQNGEEAARYYKSDFIVNDLLANSFWVNMESAEKINMTGGQLKSKSVHLSFDFPFYGHHLNKVTIEADGFITTSSLQSTPANGIIAPFIAHFDELDTTHSYVRYIDRGKSFAVEWTNLSLTSPSHFLPTGFYTFQATLFENGNIYFVYGDIPNSKEPHAFTDFVHVGLFNTFKDEISKKLRIQRNDLGEMDRARIQPAAVLFLSPDCWNNKKCFACTSSMFLHCAWCPQASLCSDASDGLDNSWVESGCHIRNVTERQECSLYSRAEY